MAKMIPPFGSQEPPSYGERMVYSLLAESLSDDFTVIHSLPWLNAIDLRAGEIRFIVMSHFFIRIFDTGNNYPDGGCSC